MHLPLSLWCKIAKTCPRTWYNLCLVIKQLGLFSLEKQTQVNIHKHFLELSKSQTRSVKTLLISKVEDEEFWTSEEFVIFCPFCKTMAHDFDCDDYIASNCVLWCEKCGESLICPQGGYSRNEYEIGRFAQHDSPMYSCSERIDENTASQFVKDWNLPENWLKQINESDDEDDSIHKLTFYLVGIVAITHLNEHKRKKKAYHFLYPCILNFSECPKHIDTSHDGIRLYYKGFCTCCKKDFESFIWGD